MKLEISQDNKEEEIIVSREEVKKRLEELLNRDEPLCVVIRGEWGVGKTYLWKEFTREKSKSYIPFKKKNYAYISLFGKHSVDDIRTDLTLQLSKFRKVAHALGEVLKATKSVSSHAGSIGSLLSLLSDKDFKNVIVCFDEFERMSPNLAQEEVLGLISYLKENLECKVVLILNEEEIQKGSLKDIYNSYKEKIVDYELRLNPPVKENFTIALSRHQKVPEEASKVLLNLAKELMIRNIRILHKLLNTLEDFSFIEESQELRCEEGYNIKQDFYTKLISLTYIATKYNWTENIKQELDATIGGLNISKVKAISSKTNPNLDEQNKQEEDEADEDKISYEVKAIIENYITDFGGIFIALPEETDYIIQYIKHGLVTYELKNKIIHILVERLNNLRNRKITAYFTSLLFELQFNYKKNVEEIVEEIKEFMSNEENLHAIISTRGIVQFIADLLFIRHLTNDKSFSDAAKSSFIRFINEANDEYFIDYIWTINLKEKINSINIERELVEEMLSVLDEKVQKSKEKFSKETDCEKIRNIILGIIRSSGWGDLEKSTLNVLTKDFVKGCLLNSTEFVYDCIQFYRWQRGGESFKGFLNTFREAVEELEIDNTRKEYLKRLLDIG